MMLAQNADSGKVDKLEKENQELRKRLDALEAVAQKEGIMPSGNQAKPISAMSNISVSGYVQASYFFNSTHPADRMADGYLWTTRQNSFSHSLSSIAQLTWQRLALVSQRGVSDVLKLT